MQDLPVPDALCGQVAGGFEQRAGGAPQRPATVLLALVGDPLAGVPQQVRQQFGDRRGLRKGQVEAPAWRGYRQPGQAQARRFRK